MDQIIQTCQMEELRKNILIMRNENININNIIAEGNALEALNRQEELSRTTNKEPLKKIQHLQSWKKKLHSMRRKKTFT